jgi:hypothetical protein
MKIAVFASCVVDGLFPDVGKATIALLQRLGHDVDLSLAQTCCGQMHTTSGIRRWPRRSCRASSRRSPATTRSSRRPDPASHPHGTSIATSHRPHCARWWTRLRATTSCRSSFGMIVRTRRQIRLNCGRVGSREVQKMDVGLPP